MVDKMSQEEYCDLRDRNYSEWHRRVSLSRFVGIELAQTLSMIDLDAAIYVEYDDHTREPLMLIETAQDVDQVYKAATVTANLARRANMPAFVLLYKLSESKLEADPRRLDIEQFRCRCIFPTRDGAWKIYTPIEWAQFLVRCRKKAAALLDGVRLVDFANKEAVEYFESDDAISDQRRFPYKRDFS